LICAYIGSAHGNYFVLIPFLYFCSLLFAKIESYVKMVSDQLHDKVEYYPREHEVRDNSQEVQ
jgi:hypothetical protein